MRGRGPCRESRGHRGGRDASGGREEVHEAEVHQRSHDERRENEVELVQAKVGPAEHVPRDSCPHPDHLLHCDLHRRKSTNPVK